MKNTKEPPIAICGHSIPKKFENGGFLVLGCAGSGKSQVLSSMIDQVRSVRKKERLVIFDPDGKHWHNFHKTGDTTVSSESKGEETVVWDLFAELAFIDEETLMRMLIGPDNISAKAIRQLVAGIIKFLKESNGTNPTSVLFANFLRERLPDPQETLLKKLLSDAPNTWGTPFINHVQNVLWKHTRFIDKTPPITNPFSVRRWLRENSVTGAALFFSRNFFKKIDDENGFGAAAALGNVFDEILSIPSSESVPTWFFIDGLSSLAPVYGLLYALAEAPARNVKIVIAESNWGYIKKFYDDKAVFNLCLTRVLGRTIFETDRIIELSGDSELSWHSLSQRPGLHYRLQLPGEPWTEAEISYKDYGAPL